MKIAAALLAAGGSSRFGRPKALVEFQGESLVRRLARELAAVAAPVLVVAPPKAGAIALELSGTGARVVVNRMPQRGMGSSIATAARATIALAPDCEALIIALVDQPLVDRSLLTALIEAAFGAPGVEGARRAGRAACDYGAGVIGPPVLFPRSELDALAALDGDRGAKELLLDRREELTLASFPGGRVDLDTPADYARLLAESDVEADAGAPGAAVDRT